MFPRRQNIRPRILGTLVFLGALLLLVNGTIIYSIRTSQRLLDQELGKRLQGTAHIAALLVQPAQFEMLALAVADTAAAADVCPDCDRPFFAGCGCRWAVCAAA